MSAACPHVHVPCRIVSSYATHLNPIVHIGPLGTVHPVSTEGCRGSTVPVPDQVISPDVTACAGPLRRA
eukprot:scaffold136260_cov130-Phaeocystis_antarctica.AAC.2